MKITKKRINEYMAKRPDMVVLEIELPEELLQRLEAIAQEWSEKHKLTLEVSDVVGIFLTEFVKQQRAKN